MQNNSIKYIINKSDDMFCERNFNIYSYNDLSSINEIKSPNCSKDINFAKLKQSPSNLNVEINTNTKYKFFIGIYTIRHL